MRSIPFWVIALLIWIIGIPLWFTLASGCCGFIGGALSIKDGATTVGHCSSNLLFGASTAAFAPLGAEVKTEYKKVADYLKANPYKSLSLTGLYGKEETFTKADGGFDNLGMARANSLKTHLMSLGVPAGQLLVGGKLAEGLNFHENQLHGGVEYAFDSLNKNISIKDGDAFSANVPDDLLFNNSGFEHIKPVSGEVDGGLEKLAIYLKANPGRTVTLTGVYDKAEKYSGILPNLGLARANDVKNLLTATGYGVSAKQIETNAQERSGLKFINNLMTGGVTYSFAKAAAAAVKTDRLAEVEAKLKTNPLILYFGTNSDKLQLSNEQRAWFADLIYYLDNKDGGRAFSTGHTDNVGDNNYNVRLGRKRAEFVVNYLKKNGVNTKSIGSKSEGPNKPIATNNTDEGKAKNRRVEITIK